jgi:hypothetical protein
MLFRHTTRCLMLVVLYPVVKETVNISFYHGTYNVYIFFASLFTEG